MTRYALVNERLEETYKLRYARLACRSRRREQIQMASLIVLQRKTVTGGLDECSAT